MPLPAVAVAAPYVVSGAAWGWRAYRLYRAAKKAEKAAKAAARAAAQAKAAEESQTCKDCDKCPVCGQSGGDPQSDPGKDPPDYVQNPRAPMPDDVPHLSGPGYEPTGKTYTSGAKIYKTPSGGYTYIDRAHKGKGAHLETFDKNGNWTGKVCPACGRKRPGRDNEWKKKKLGKEFR